MDTSHKLQATASQLVRVIESHGGLLHLNDVKDAVVALKQALEDNKNYGKFKTSLDCGIPTRRF